MSSSDLAARPRPSPPHGCACVPLVPPQAEQLKQDYYKWLLETGQEEAAGGVKEREGDYLGAIGLYLKGGLPGRAAQVGRASSWLLLAAHGDCIHTHTPTARGACVQRCCFPARAALAYIDVPRAGRVQCPAAQHTGVAVAGIARHPQSRGMHALPPGLLSQVHR